MWLNSSKSYFKHCVNLAPKFCVRYPTQLLILLKMPGVISEHSHSLFKYLLFIYQQIFSSGGNGGNAVRGPCNPSRMSTAWQSVNDLIVRQTRFVRPVISVSATFWNINTRDELRVDWWTIWATLLNKDSRNDMAKICSRLNYGIVFNWTLFILLRVGSALSCKTTRNPGISGTRRLVSHLCSRGELHLGSSKQFNWNFPFSECYDSVRQDLSWTVTQADFQDIPINIWTPFHASSYSQSLQCPRSLSLNNAPSNNPHTTPYQHHNLPFLSTNLFTFR